MTCNMCDERTKKLLQCTVCGDHQCFRCGAQWGSGVETVPYQCCICLGTSFFIAGRGIAACALNAKVVDLLSNSETAAKSDKSALNELFCQFVEMILVWNEWGCVKGFGLTIKKMLAFQRENKLGSTLTGSLTMRLQLPEGMFNEVVRAASILEAETQMRLPPPARLPQRVSVPRDKPLLLFYLYDLANHPLTYLIFELLRGILKNGRVNVHILVMRKAPDVEYAEFMKDLRNQFLEKKCWTEFCRDLNSKHIAARRFLGKLNPTIFVDLVGNMHGQLTYFPEPWYGQKVAHYLNTACMIFDKRRHFGVFDRGMLEGRPKDWEDGSGEECKALSLWQSALPGFLLDMVDRSIKHSVREFNLFIHVNLDRIGEISELCFKILNRFDDARMHYQANPRSLIPVIHELARKFEEQNHLTAGKIESRIVPWQFVRMEEFIRQLRAEGIHLMLSGGVYPANTGQQVGMGAGVVGMIVPFDSMMNRAPRYMNSFVGTGALNPLNSQDAFDMIVHLYANRHILDVAQAHYDDLAINKKSIFDPNRAVMDWEAMAYDEFAGGNESSFCGTKPLPPILEAQRDELKKLVQINVLPMRGQGEPGMASQQSEDIQESMNLDRPGFCGTVNFFGGGSVVQTRTRRGDFFFNDFKQLQVEAEASEGGTSVAETDVASGGGIAAASSAPLEEALITMNQLHNGAQLGLGEVDDLETSRESGGGGSPGGGGASGGGSAAPSADLAVDLSKESDNEGESGASRGGAASGPYPAHSDRLQVIVLSDDEDEGGTLGGGRASGGSASGGALNASRFVAGADSRLCTLSECHCRQKDFGNKPIDCTGFEKVQPMDARSRGINDDGTHRLLPPTMREDQLKEATLELSKGLAAAVTEALNEMVAGALADKLAEHGFAIVRRATLESIIPGYMEMWGKAREELLVVLNVNRALPETIFHNESKTLYTVDAGDKNRSAGKIAPQGPCRILLDTVIKVVTNGSFQLLESHDGILQASALYQKRQAHADYDPQAHHVDNRVLADRPAGRLGDKVVVANMKSMADSRTAVRSAWVNMWNKPIRLSVHTGSHKLAQVCERTYSSHFQAVFAHFQSTGIDASVFLEIWAKISATHLENEFPGREAAGAATVLAESGDLIIMLGNFVHGGTGDEGLRLFGNHVHKRQADPSDSENFFHHVHNSTELIGNSDVYAGIRRFCRPDGVGDPWMQVCNVVNKQCKNIFSLRRLLGNNVQPLLNHLLTEWNTEPKGWCRPDMDQEVQSIGGDLAAVPFKEVCNRKRRLLVVFELRKGLQQQPRLAEGVVRDVRNSPAVCHAMCHSDLHQRTRRSDVIAVSPPAWKELAGYTGVVEGCRICWTAMELPVRCEPLGAIFGDWNDKGVLTEPLRWRVLSFFRALEDLWPVGFYMLVFDPNMFVYDQEADKMVLVFAGLGYLGPSDAMVANCALVAGPVPMTRRSTSFYLDTGKSGTVDSIYLKDLREQAAAELDAAEQAAKNGEEGAAGDDWGDEEVARQLLAPQLTKAKAKMVGKKVGFPRVPTEESFLDGKLRASVFGETEVEFKTVRDEAKQTDLHQVLLWLASMFSKRPRSKNFMSDLLPLLAPELGDDAAIDFMLEKCFQVARPRTRNNGGGSGGQQPAGLRRFAQLLALGLREGTRGAVLHELSLMPGVSHPIYSPDQEGQLAGEGIHLTLEPYPITGDEFKAKADDAIRKAGLRVDDARKWVCLINEGEKGVGVRVVGRFELLWFFGFYIGIAGEGHGRYVVSTPGQGEVGERCDAAPCKDLPLSWFIEKGVPCPFINAAASTAEANIHLHRENLFFHDWNGKKLICIPMGVCKVIEDASFASWFYSFVAVRGRSMRF